MSSPLIFRGFPLFRHPLVGLGLATVLVGCALVSGIADYDLSSSPPDGADGSDNGVGGELLPSSLVATPTSIDFGNVRCGSAAAADLSTKEIVIENRGDVETPWSASLPSASSFELVGATAEGRLTGTLAAHAKTTIVVKAKPIIAGLQRIELVIETTAGTATTNVTIIAMAQGVGIDVNPSIVDFGDVRYQNGGAPIPVAFTNKGTDAVTLQLASDGDDFEIAPKTLNLAAGGSGAVNATLKSGAAADNVLVRPLVLSVSPDTVLCGNLPSVELRGRRIITDVTTSPGTIDFGSVGCGPTPATKEITITNYAMSDPINVAAAFSAGARFTVVSGAPQTIPPATGANSPSIGKVAVRPTTPLMAPVGVANASIGVTITGAPLNNGSELRTIPIVMSVTGPILTWVTGDTLDFGKVAKNAKSDKTLWLRNTGNVSAAVTYSVSSTPTSPHFFGLRDNDSDGLDTIVSSAVLPEDVELRFAPTTNNGHFTGSVTMTTTPPSCSPPLVGILKGEAKAASGTTTTSGNNH